MLTSAISILTYILHLLSFASMHAVSKESVPVPSTFAFKKYAISGIVNEI
ncbi:hypothetical protein J6Z48_03300 [bacterium]|nr:hypothetical protein [bacterium]